MLASLTPETVNENTQAFEKGLRDCARRTVVVSHEAAHVAFLLSQGAVNDLNLPVVMATVLIAAFFIVAMNIIVDMLYAVIDPRVRLG